MNCSCGNTVYEYLEVVKHFFSHHVVFVHLSPIILLFFYIVAALRGVAIQRGRARGALATAFARHASPLTAAAAATALHGYAP